MKSLLITLLLFMNFILIANNIKIENKSIDLYSNVIVEDVEPGNLHYGVLDKQLSYFDPDNELIKKESIFTEKGSEKYGITTQTNYYINDKIYKYEMIFTPKSIEYNNLASTVEFVNEKDYVTEAIFNFYDGTVFKLTSEKLDDLSRNPLARLDLQSSCLDKVDQNTKFYKTRPLRGSAYVISTQKALPLSGNERDFVDKWCRQYDKVEVGKAINKKVLVKENGKNFYFLVTDPILDKFLEQDYLIVSYLFLGATEDGLLFKVNSFIF